MLVFISSINFRKYMSSLEEYVDSVARHSSNELLVSITWRYCFGTHSVMKFKAIWAGYCDKFFLHF